MPNILFSPTWFYGKDILIDIVSIVVLLLIAYVTLRYYQLNKKNKQHLMFSVASLLLASSFLFKILTNFTLYQHIFKTQQVGLFTLIYHFIQYSDVLFLVGTLLYRLVTLIGLYLLFCVYYKEQSKPLYFLMLFFIFISTYYTSETYYIFHITALLFLSFIVTKYYNNYHKTKDKPAQFIFFSFSIIMLSQLLFIFIGVEEVIYVVAELIQLLGYILLLSSFILVIYYGKKK